MMDDIRNLLAYYKSDLSAMKTMRYGFSGYDSGFVDGEEAMLERVIEDLQKVLDRNQNK